MILMLLATAKSKNNIKIRLTNERLGHITYSHPEIIVSDYKKIINTIEKPVAIFVGNNGEYLACSKTEI